MMLVKEERKEAMMMIYLQVPRDLMSTFPGQNDMMFIMFITHTSYSR